VRPAGTRTAGWGEGGRRLHACPQAVALKLRQLGHVGTRRVPEREPVRTRGDPSRSHVGHHGVLGVEGGEPVHQARTDRGVGAASPAQGSRVGPCSCRKCDPGCLSPRRVRADGSPRLRPPRKRKCSSGGTRDSNSHRGSPDRRCSNTSSASWRAGYHQSACRAGYHPRNSGRSMASRTSAMAAPDRRQCPTGYVSLPEYVEERS
jgi:hypothetical protein